MNNNIHDMAKNINNMVSYEIIDTIFDHKLEAEKHDRMIIQKKCKIKEENCSICLLSVFEKKVVFLPCKHFFHHTCLTQSIDSNHYLCPLCRYDLKPSLLKIDHIFPQQYTQSDYIYDYLWFYLFDNLTNNIPVSDLSNVDLSNVDLSTLDLSTLDLSTIDLSNVDLSTIDLSTLDLSNNDIDLSNNELLNYYLFDIHFFYNNHQDISNNQNDIT